MKSKNTKAEAEIESQFVTLDIAKAIIRAASNPELKFVTVTVPDHNSMRDSLNTLVGDDNWTAKSESKGKFHDGFRIKLKTGPGYRNTRSWELVIVVRLS